MSEFSVPVATPFNAVWLLINANKLTNPDMATPGTGGNTGYKFPLPDYGVINFGITSKPVAHTPLFRSRSRLVAIE